MRSEGNNCAHLARHSARSPRGRVSLSGVVLSSPISGLCSLGCKISSASKIRFRFQAFVGFFFFLVRFEEKVNR